MKDQKEAVGLVRACNAHAGLVALMAEAADEFDRVASGHVNEYDDMRVADSFSKRIRAALNSAKEGA